MPSRTITGNSPRREQRLQSLLLDRLTLRYERRVALEISRTMREAAPIAKYPGALNAVIERHKARLSVLLNDLWSSSIDGIIEHMFGKKKGAGGPASLKRDEFPIFTTPSADRIARDYVRLYGATKITQVSSTTAESISEIVQEGIVDGLSEKEIARLINKIAPTKGASRAQTIARTETHQATQWAAQESAEEIGVKMKREWVSAEGERTRDAHSEASGQIVDMNESFSVGGEDLMVPGDPSGSPWNTINCRCVVAFVLE